MSIFSWRFEALDGSAVVPSDTPSTSFPSQADAETWIGETWRTLAEEGVDQVSLLRDGEAVYGPMSLRPSE